jgi:hypothetical protein
VKAETPREQNPEIDKIPETPPENIVVGFGRFHLQEQYPVGFGQNL